jgi:hypothetical protein
MLVPRLPRRVGLPDVERALIEAFGNVTEAACALGVPPTLLRQAVRAMPLLEAAVQEGVQQLLDQAEAEVHKGLKSRKAAVRLGAASFVLKNSPAAKRRGWGRYGRPPAPAELHWPEAEEISLPEAFVLGKTVNRPTGD